MEPPPGWTTPATPGVRAAAVVPPAVVTFAALPGIDDYEPLLAAGFVFALLLAVHLIALVISLAWSPAPAVTGSFSFRYATGRYYWVVAIPLFAALWVGTLAVAAARVGGAAWLITVMFGGLAAVLVACAGTALRLAPGRVELTSAGIRQRSILHEHFVPWTAVAGVWATPARPGRLANITVRVVPGDGIRVRRPLGVLSGLVTRLPDMVIATYWLGANAEPAYRALSYYFQHPEERPAPAAADAAGSGSVPAR
jgi:hypothetical protein